MPFVDSKRVQSTSISRTTLCVEANKKVQKKSKVGTHLAGELRARGYSSAGTQPASCSSSLKSSHKTHLHAAPLPPPSSPLHQVILTKDIANVGIEGEIRSVPVGYWRNYLLPNGLAKFASIDILK